jgi:hypothetical protein
MPQTLSILEESADEEDLIDQHQREENAQLSAKL